MMRSFFVKAAPLTIAVAMGLFRAQAQEQPVFLFDDFQAATVKFKTGGSTKASLNYSLGTQEMVFKSGSTLMALSDLQKIDTIFFKDRKFVVDGEAFKEVIPVKNHKLYVAYRTTKADKGANTGIGSKRTTETSGKSEGGSTVKARGVEGDSQGFNVKYVDDELTARSDFYLKSPKGDFQLIKDVKSFDASYPGRQEDIKKYIKDNNLSLAKRTDLLNLLAYLN